MKIIGGEGGIRTHGGRKPTPVFETGFAHPPNYDELRYANKLKQSQSSMHSLSSQVSSRHRAIGAPTDRPPTIQVVQN